MPPASAKRKLTADEQVAQLQRRSRKITFQVKFSKITRVLQENMHLTDTVVNHLESVLDMSLDDALARGAGQVDLTSESGSLALRRAPSGASLATEQGSPAKASAGSGSAQGSEASEKLAEEESHQSWCYSKLSGYSLVLLTALLGSMEPSSLSKHALKAVVIRGKRLESQRDLLRILQFLTGLSEGWSATGAYKKNTVLYAYMNALHLARGRRGAGMILPVRWEAFGVYSLKIVGRKLFLHQAFVGTEVEVPAQVVKKLGGGVSDIRIDQNWSENEACLTSPKVADSHLCVLLIPGHIANQAALDTFYTETLPELTGQAPIKQEALADDDGETKEETEVAERGAYADSQAGSAPDLAMAVLAAAGLDVSSDEEPSEVPSAGAVKREGAESEASAERPVKAEETTCSPTAAPVVEPAFATYDEYEARPPPPEEWY